MQDIPVTSRDRTDCVPPPPRIFCPALARTSRNRSALPPRGTQNRELCILRRRTVVQVNDADLVVSREIIPNAWKVTQEQAQTKAKGSRVMTGPEDDSGLTGRVAIVSGGGAAGDGIGNGRAAAILLARAGD